MNIDTFAIADALRFYGSCGFQSARVPMLVDPDVSALTKPEGLDEVYHPSGKVYVASAEQSFIQLWKDGELLTPGTSWMALTPCVRMEEQDESHLTTFLKLELMIVGLDDVELTLEPALRFFQGYDPDAYVIQTNDGYDIEIGGIEVGSYGVRHMLDGTSYVYGTGVAEPRLSYALKQAGII